MQKFLHIPVRNERGIALALVLVLSLIALAIVSSVLYMSTQWARISGGEKFFRSADEAALGGARLATDLVSMNFESALAGAILTAPFGGTTLNTVLFNNAGAPNCLTQKLSLPPGGGFANWTACGATNYSLDIISTDNTTFDMRFQLPGTPNSYNVYAKIIDTIEGNTAGAASSGGGGIGGPTGGSGGGLSTGGVGSGGASIVTPPRISWIYRIDVQAQDSVNPRELSRYTVLYAR